MFKTNVQSPPTHMSACPCMHRSHLTIQEQARLEYDLTVAAFDTFDKDGDGNVTVEELAQTLVSETV